MKVKKKDLSSIVNQDIRKSVRQYKLFCKRYNDPNARSIEKIDLYQNTQYESALFLKRVHFKYLF